MQWHFWQVSGTSKMNFHFLFFPIFSSIFRVMKADQKTKGHTMTFEQGNPIKHWRMVLFPTKHNRLLNIVRLVGMPCNVGSGSTCYVLPVFKGHFLIFSQSFSNKSQIDNTSVYVWHGIVLFPVFFICYWFRLGCFINPSKFALCSLTEVNA